MSSPAEKRKPGRPRTGVTPKRNIRVGAVWDDAAAIAAARGETMTSVVAAALRRYVARHQAQLSESMGRTDEGDRGDDSSHSRS